MQKMLMRMGFSLISMCNPLPIPVPLERTKLATSMSSSANHSSALALVLPRLRLIADSSRNRQPVITNAGYSSPPGMTGSQQTAGTVTMAVQPVCIFVMDSSSTLVPPQLTPIKHGTTTMARFTTNHKYQQKEMSDMGDEMRDYIVGPMPTSRFLNEFFPKKSIQSTDKAKVYRPGCFDKVVSCSDEIQAYAPFVRSIHYDHPLTCIHFMLQIKAAAPFAPNLKFVNSSTHSLLRS